MTKQILIIASLAFCLILVNATFAVDPVGDQQPGLDSSTPTVTSTPDNLASQSEKKLIVYYFHGRKRCMSCKTIEAEGTAGAHLVGFSHPSAA